MKFTNSEVETMYLGIQNIVMESPRTQRKLPMLPSVRLKRMMEDLEGYYEQISELRQDKQETIQEIKDELQERVDDDEDEYTADDMREDVNGKAEELGEEMQEVMDEEVSIEFGDPVTMDDIERIDKVSDEFNFTASSAVDIIMRKVVDTDGDK